MKYENTWVYATDYEGEEIVKSEKRPGEYWLPCYPASRVNGSSYRPYRTGSPEWQDAVNTEMAEHAHQNFIDGRR